jgi:hypothetical protein
MDLYIDLLDLSYGYHRKMAYHPEAYLQKTYHLIVVYLHRMKVC